jgi:hypothetical protein
MAMSARHALLTIGLLACLGCNEPTIQPLDMGLAAQPTEVVAFMIRDYQPSAGSEFKEIFVSNFSVEASRGVLHYSTSRDSLPDSLKSLHGSDYGFGTLVPDSNSDGFSDLVVWLAGISLLPQRNLWCSPNLRAASANDAFIYNDARLPGSPQVMLGLRDCEKLYLGLNSKEFDFDQDGIPDYLELRCGLNPRNPNDAQGNMAGIPKAIGKEDFNYSNMEKCRRHLPVDEDPSTQPNRLYAYQYKIELSQIDGSRDFTISNIPILNGGKDNFIAFTITEVEPANGARHLFTAYTILKAGAGGNTYKFVYWGTDPAKTTNQEIVF